MDSNTMTYDALGEVVEVANGSAYTVFEYTPIGSKIVWNESNQWTRGHLPMPGGTSLDWTPSATYIHHKDWLGSSRITTVAGVVYTDKAFGAYGEDTAQDFGPATNFNYTGDSQDIATAVYDTPNREYMPYQSRWPNVDPSHHGWNGYAYAGNPLSMIDPSGLEDIGSDDTLDGGISDGEIDATIQETGEGDSIGSDSTEELDQSIVQDAASIELTLGDNTSAAGTASPEQTAQYNAVAGTSLDSSVNGGFGYTNSVDGALTFTDTVNAQANTTSSQNSSDPSGSAPGNNWGPLYPPSIFTPVNNMPIVSQWRPPKPTDVVKPPYKPLPYKPSVGECFTNPGNAVDLMTEGTPQNPEEHDPSAPVLVYHNGTTMGSQSLNSDEADAEGNGWLIVITGAVHFVGCMVGAVFGH
jgi:RHS repeat-associated protein